MYELLYIAGGKSAPKFRRMPCRGGQNRIYDSDLADAQWAFFQPMLPKSSNRGRTPTDRPRIINAVLNVVGDVGHDAGKRPKRHVLVDTLVWCLA